jgi:uncharacterized protein (TIGR03067 family)
MKTFRALLLVGLAAFSLSLALADNNDAAKKDIAALQGEWAMVSGSADGFPMPEAMIPRLKRVCKGDEITVTANGQLIMKAKITVDPSQKPKIIDYEVTGGPNQGKKQLGIYELDGDTFKSCFAAPDAERPKDFTSKEGDKRTSSVWKRKKAAEPTEKKQ